MKTLLTVFAIFTTALFAEDNTLKSAWVSVQKGSAVNGVSASGRVVPQDGALNIESARVQGRVLAILKRDGDSVSVGTPLYSISSAECLSLMEERRVAEEKNIPELVDGVKKREKQLGLRVNKNQCHTVSTHAGVITKRNVESGSSFNQGDAMATILDTTRLTIELDIPERDQGKVKIDQKVSFQFSSNNGQSFESKIQTVVPTIDPATRTSRARLVPIHLPPSVSLEALVFGKIDTGNVESALRVPSSALVFHHDQQYVVIGNEKKSNPVAVVVLNESDGESVIRPVTEGAIKEDDLVLTRGAIFLVRKILGDAK